MILLPTILAQMVARGGSDLHVSVGVPPKSRISGSLENLADSPITEEEMKGFLKLALSGDQLRGLVQNCDMDGLYFDPKIGRFRVNAFKQLGSYSMVLRHIPTKIASIDDLKLPQVLKDLALSERGIVLVTGTTGSGKSTSLAAMINHINVTKSSNIITIEDPVEFVHASKKSIIRQRNLGTDVGSFALALKFAMRQDPDVILVGEMRDFETIQSAVTAADTGHLVFSTLHTTNAQQTMERILNFYPGDQQDQIRLNLSLNIQGVLSQRLLRKSDGKGRVAAIEIMLGTPTVRKLIREGRVPALYEVIEEGRSDGMQSFNQVIYDLFADELIDLDVALSASSRPDELRLKLKMDGLI